MANAYSILHNYHQDLYTPDYNLIGSVMQYKQGKLDANRERLQTLYDELSVMDVAKGEDKEYIENRLQAAKNIVNKYSAMDLSNSGFANDLIGKLSTVIDDNVKNAVIGTRRYRAEQAAWDKLHEESPELYNETNRSYAQQPAKAWLSDGKAGTEYRGGGGVIEYDDYQKRWQESIPDIAEALGDNYEYVTNEYGVGMFIDKVTKRAVDRGKISGIMDSILGEKGRRQQQIDAWGRYDGVDPSIVKEQYDAFLEPRIDEANRYIKELKSLVSKSTGEKRQQYQNSLDAWEKRKSSYLSGSYDNLVKRDPNGGNRTAYQTMFSSQVKEPWLDVYTYEEKVIEREIDQNHLKTLEFEEDVRQFNLNYEQKEREIQNKKKKTRDGLIEYVDGVATVVEEDLSIITLDEDEIQDFAAYQKLYYEGIKDLKGVVGNLSGAQLIDVGRQLNGRDFSNSDRITLTIGGKEKIISFVDKDGNDNGNRSKLLSFMDKSYNSTPEVREMRKQIDADITNIQSRLIEEYAVNPGIARDFAAYSKEIVRIGGTDEEPLYEVRDVEGTGNRYKELLKKASTSEGLTDAEQLTLDLYVTTQIISDPKTDKRLAREAYVQLRHDFVNKIGYKQFEKLPSSARSIRETSLSLTGATQRVDNMGTSGPVQTILNNDLSKYYTDSNPLYMKIVKSIGGKPNENGSYDVWGMSFDPGQTDRASKMFAKYNQYLTTRDSKEKASIKKSLEHDLKVALKSRDFIVPTSYNDDARLYNLGWWDTETDTEGRKDFTTLMNDMNERIDVSYEPSLAKSFLSPEAPQYMISQKDSRYERLSELIQVKTGTKPSGAVTIALDVDQKGVRTGKGIVYQYTDKEGNIINAKTSDELGEDKFLTEKSLVDIGLPFASLGRTSYDASFGSAAPKVQLGGSKPAKHVEDRVSNTLAKNGLPLAMNNAPSVKSILKLAGDISPIKKAEVAQKIIDFRNGKYYFTLEANDYDKEYNMVMYREGKVIDTRATTDRFSEEDLSLFIGNEVNVSTGDYGALYLKHAMFNDYLNSDVLNSEVDKELEISQQEVQEFLQSLQLKSYQF